MASIGLQYFKSPEGKRPFFKRTLIAWMVLGLIAVGAFQRWGLQTNDLNIKDFSILLEGFVAGLIVYWLFQTGRKRKFKDW